MPANNEVVPSTATRALDIVCKKWLLTRDHDGAKRTLQFLRQDGRNIGMNVKFLDPLVVKCSHMGIWFAIPDLVPDRTTEP